MSKSAAFGFQGGAFVEVFTPQGKEPTAAWKVSGSVKKIFEKEVKSYIYVLEGVPTTTRLQLPKDGKTTVTLVQRYLLLQLHLAKGQDFSLELGLTDLGKNKRRVLFSTSQRDIQTTPLHAKIPLSIVKRGIWLNLCIDLASLVADTWKGQTFRSVEAISISANCKLRRVFTMKLPPADTTDDEDVYDLSSSTSEIDQIPRQCQLAPDIQQLTQVFTINKLKAIERIKSGYEGTRRPDSMLDLDLNTSTRRSMQNDSNSYRIAFGSKVAVNTTSRKPVKDNLSTSRSSRSSSSRVEDTISARNNVPVKDGERDSLANHTLRSPLYDQSKSDTAALGAKQLDTQGDSVRTELAFSQPHPPREPSKDRQRRRIRVKGHGSDSVIGGQTKEDTSKKEVFVTGLNNTTSNDEDANSSSNSKFSSEGDLEDGGVGELITEDKSLQTPRFRDLTARAPAETRDSGVGPFVPEIQSPRKESGDGAALEESMSDVIRMLRGQVEVMTSGDSDSDTNVGEYVESDDAEENGVYMFASPPKSAPHRNLSPSQDEDTSQSRKLSSKTTYLRKLNSSLSSRGARLDSDFMDSASSDSDVEVTSRQKVTARTHSGGKSSAGRARQDALGGKPRSAEDSFRQPPSMSGRQSEYSPENYRNRGAGDITLSPRLNASSMSRMSRKSLREIPRTDARLSLAKPAEIFGAYDHTKYQVVEELTDSFEARMLASLKRQQDEDDSQVGGTRHVNDSYQRDLAPATGHARSQQLLHVEESPTTTSDDDTSFSTWKAPAAGQLVHNYQEEMRYPHSRLSSDTLTSSNPRDWSGVFSPPVGLPGDTVAAQSSEADKLSGETNHTDSPGGEQRTDDPPTALTNGDRAATRQEEELDLLYDPCLNCYFDPQTCKYYELV